MTTSKSHGSVGRGVAIALGLHVVQVAIVPALTFVYSFFDKTTRPTEFGTLAGFFVAIAAWSITQFLYLGPAAWLARRHGNTEDAKGILIVAGIGVLLNGLCDATLFFR